MGYVEGMDRRQTILFPETVDEYIEEDNPVQFIDAFVESLDLKELEFKYSEPELTGRPPYNPADMLKLYLYGYLNRIRSSRKLEKETRRNVELMWLVKKLSPDFKTIADFRKDNRRAIKKVCREFTVLCKRLDLFGGELVAIDGSKFKASNSKKRNFNEGKLKRRIKQIEEKVEGYLSELEDNDRKEADVPRMNKEELKAKVGVLKERGKEYKKLLKELKASGETQVSQTDPDSRAMVANQRIEVSYNVQTTVDEKHKLIVDHEVTNEMKDYKHLAEMCSRAKEILGVDTLEVLADKGYYSAEAIMECTNHRLIPYIPRPASTVSKKVNVPRPEFYDTKFEYDTGRDFYICPGGNELSYRSKAKIHGKIMRLYKSKDCVECELRDKCTRQKAGRIIYRWEHEKILEDMHKRVEQNRDKVKRRQWLSEHPFGTIKRGFDQGYLLTRGIENVGAEISLSILAYNIKRVINIIGMQKLMAIMGGTPEVPNGTESGPIVLFSARLRTETDIGTTSETILLLCPDMSTWAN